MWKGVAIAVAFAGACMTGRQDTPRAARVRKQCMDQVSGTNDNQAWMEKYCDTVVTKSEGEWRQGSDGGVRDASADPAGTESHASARPDAGTNEGASSPKRSGTVRHGSRRLTRRKNRSKKP